MARYLTRLERDLRARGFACPFLLMTSGGGLTGFETAVAFPIRLVESGPAGGAILASRVASECDLDQVLSFDMGGTTAKICLIDEATPLTSRSLEVARVYRFLKGSGLPLRIPAIEMVEIGAGGGSIASVDALKRINVGPESAGAMPGSEPTVTDADVALGRIDIENFAGGSVALQPEAAASAIARVLSPLGLEGPLAAFAVSEVVDENMANAARVHAIEWGKEISHRALIAFGGAAPLHAARLAEKLDLDQVIVPTGAGVGSAIGFLRAPIAYEVVRSRYQRLSDFDIEAVNAALEEMEAEAYAIVEPAAAGAEFAQEREAYMRYLGQGHEITVALPARPLEAADVAQLQTGFDAAYTRLYGRTIPNLDVEVLSWTLTVKTVLAAPERAAKAAAQAAPAPRGSREVFDSATEKSVEAAVYDRADLSPGTSVPGPALIVEDQTTTVVSSSFEAAVNSLGYIVLVRR
jgi:N-methylhydantoinase A